MLSITHNAKRLTEKRKNCILAAQFHACRLGIAEISETIKINFIKGFQKQNQEYANCGPDNGQLTINIDDALKYDQMQSTIAHEMVHAKQWLTGELSLTRSGNMRWNNKRVSSKQIYHRAPWEIEAMSKEILMAHEYSYFVNWRTNSRIL